MENEIVVPEKVTKFAVGLVGRAKEFVVNSDESNERVTDFLARVKMGIKEIETWRKKRAEPMIQTKKDLDDEAKEKNKSYIEARDILNKKQIDWARKVRDKERAEQAERDKIEAKRLQDIEDKKKKLADKGIKANLPEPVIEEPAEEKKSVKSSGMYSTSNVRFVKKAKLIDLSKVPLDLHLFNQAKADQLIKNGAKEIPGCEIVEVGINTNRGA